MNWKHIWIAVAMFAEVALLPVRAQANQAPQLTANNGLVVNQGASAVVTASILGATDAESPPGQVVFTIAPGGNGGAPRNGVFRLSGTLLVAGSTFTQDDLNQGRLVYQHDDSRTTTDDFQFDVSDPDGARIPGPPFFAYSFLININLINHAPVAGHSSGSTGYGVSFHGLLSATDGDIPIQTLNYRIVTNGLKGTALLTDTNTGAFVYTPNAGERGPDTITFQVNDGFLDSVNPGTFTITLKPSAFSATFSILESSTFAGTLPATNVIPPHALTYRLATNASLGNVVVTDTNAGAFSYSPAPGVVGLDTFAFVVNDGFLDSEPATCTLKIQPIVEPGDLFVTGSGARAVFYVDRNTAATSVVAAGQYLGRPNSCVLERTGKLLVMDAEGGVVRVNPADGTQAVVSPGTNFSKAVFGPLGIAIEPGGTILVADGVNGLVRVALDTGVVTPLAKGGNLLVTLGVVVATNGDIYVTDAARLVDTNQPSRVVRIDPESGAQTVISAGTNLDFPVGIAMEGPASLVVSDAAGYLGRRNLLLRIGVTNGSQNIIAEEGNLIVPAGLEIDDQGKILVVSVGLNKVVQVDPVNGSQTVVASGSGSPSLLGLAVAHAADLPDTDGDGLPDWWEQRNFPYTDASADGDADHDGMNNQAEFKAGTGPMDSQSTLKLDLKPAPAGGFVLEWGSVSQRSYTLERASVLPASPADFEAIITGIQATAPRNTLAISELGEGAYFYRLRLEE